MKNPIITIVIILMHLPIAYSQELKEIDFELKEKPWNIEINHDAQQLKYYYHTTSEKEDIATNIYTVNFDAKVINKETEKNSIAETRLKYPWYFYAGDRFEQESYGVSFVAGSFIFKREYTKMIYHPKKRFYEHVLRPMKTKYKYLKFNGKKMKSGGVTNVQRAVLVEDKIFCQINEFSYLISDKDHTDYYVKGNQELGAEIKKLDYGRVNNHSVETVYENGKVCGYRVFGIFVEGTMEYKSGLNYLKAYVDINGNVINVMKFDNINSFSQIDENKTFYKVKENGKHYSYLLDNKLKVLEKKEIKSFPIDPYKSTSILRYGHKNSFHILFDINKVTLYVIDEENNIINQQELQLSFELKEGYMQSFPLLTKFDDVFYTSISLESEKDERAFLYIKTDGEKILSAKVNMENNENFNLYKDKVPKPKHFYKAGSIDYTLRFSKSGGLIADYHYSHLEKDGHSLLAFFDTDGKLIKTTYKEISAPESFYFILLTHYHPNTYLFEGEKNYYWISGTYENKIMQESAFAHNENCFITIIDKKSYKISKSIKIDAPVNSNSIYSKGDNIYILDNEGKISSISME